MFCRGKVLFIISLFFFLTACGPSLSTLRVKREQCDSFFRGKTVSVIEGQPALPHTRSFFEAELIAAGANVFDSDGVEYRITARSGFTLNSVSFDGTRYLTAWASARVRDQQGRVPVNVQGEISFYENDYSFFAYDAFGYSYDSRAVRRKNAIDAAAMQARNDLICAPVRTHPVRPMYPSYPSS